MASISGVDGIDASALRLFLAAIEFGSVSKAAQRTNVTQPSATAKLQKLERQLGVTLLERSRVGSRPTAAGARLAPVCAEVLESLESLVDRAHAMRTERDRITVATTRHVADHFFPEWLPGLDLERIHLDLVETSTRGVARSVRADEAVIGFTEGPDEPIGLGSKIVGAEPIDAVIGRGHPWWRRRDPVSVEELRGTTLVLSTVGSGTRHVVEAALGGELGRAGDEVELVEVANASIARVSVLAGVGVGFLPRCWTRHPERGRSMRSLEIEGIRIEQPVRVVWRGTHPSTAAARHFVERLPAQVA
jgi:DNA-binding transcriptional LysR family regulator